MEYLRGIDKKFPQIAYKVRVSPKFRSDRQVSRPVVYASSVLRRYSFPLREMSVHETERILFCSQPPF
jgi:hypothetical protein